MIKRIRIPAEFRRDDTRTHTAVADFTLGLGPCGKEVVELNIRADADGVEVTQLTADGEGKGFFYPMHTLTGRVETTYGS